MNANPIKTGKIYLKRLLPHSLLGRSLMIMIVPVLLAQIIATYVFFDLHWNKMTSRMSYAVSGEIAIMAKSIEQGTDLNNLNQVMGFAAQSLGLLISFEKGAELREPENLSNLPFWESSAVKTLSRELTNRLKRPFVIDLNFKEKWIQIQVKLTNGVLSVSLPERRFYSSSGYVFLLWMIGSSFILFAVAVLFMRNQIRPIRKLAIAADRLGKGREVQFFKPEGASEVRQAGKAFMDMHERIKKQIAQRTTMLAGVSHDLRTPLTRLKLQLAMMGDSPDVEAMQDDVSQMEKMIAGYLDFVRGQSDEQTTLTDLGQMIERVAVSARRQGLEIESHAEKDINVMLRPMAFERCLANIVSNAGKYASRVWIAAGLRAGNVEIAIDDNGPGIPEDQYEEVFKPFYRVDSSRNAATGGVGLGLPIALDIARAHGGNMWLEPSPRGGLRVVVTVPV